MCLKQGKCIKLLCIVIPGTYLDWLSAHQWVVSSNTWMQIKQLLEAFNYFVQQRPKPMHNYNQSDLGPLLQPYTFKIFSWVRHRRDSYFGGSNHHSLFPPTVPQSDIQLPPHLKNDLIDWGDSTTNRCAVCTDMPPWTDILNESIFACSALRPAFLHPPTSTQFTATIELLPCWCSQRCFIDRLDQRRS